MQVAAPHGEERHVAPFPHVPPPTRSSIRLLGHHCAGAAWVWPVCLNCTLCGLRPFRNAWCCCCGGESPLPLVAATHRDRPSAPAGCCEYRHWCAIFIHVWRPAMMTAPPCQVYTRAERSGAAIHTTWPPTPRAVQLATFLPCHGPPPTLALRGPQTAPLFPAFLNKGPPLIIAPFNRESRYRATQQPLRYQARQQHPPLAASTAAWRVTSALAARAVAPPAPEGEEFLA